MSKTNTVTTSDHHSSKAQKLSHTTDRDTLYSSTELFLNDKTIYLNNDFYFSNALVAKSNGKLLKHSVFIDAISIEPFLDILNEKIRCIDGSFLNEQQLSQIIIGHSFAIAVFTHTAIFQCMQFPTSSVKLIKKSIKKKLKKSNMTIKVTCDKPTVAYGLSFEFLNICSSVLHIKPKNLTQETLIPEAETYDVTINLACNNFGSIQSFI